MTELPPRWTREEQSGIDQVRERMGSLLTDRPQFPDVVGDRKILRFLRGNGYSVDKVCELMTKFLSWRDAQGVDQIRENILRGGMNHPRKFPNGEKILAMVPQIVIAPYCCDKNGSPICVDQYNFSPTEVLSNVTVPEYLQFIIYSLEFKTLVVEQLSEEREQAAIAHLLEAKKGKGVVGGDGEKERSACVPYGVLLYTCVIRNLSGVGFEHVGAKGQEIIQVIISVASANYPELMRKCFMINAPWVFNALWYFIKGLLPARTIAKVSVMGANFKAAIDSEISPENLPSLIGGPYALDEPFEFDQLYYSLSSTNTNTGPSPSCSPSPSPPSSSFSTSSSSFSSSSRLSSVAAPQHDESSGDDNSNFKLKLKLPDKIEIALSHGQGSDASETPILKSDQFNKNTNKNTVEVEVEVEVVCAAQSTRCLSDDEESDLTFQNNINNSRNGRGSEVREGSSVDLGDLKFERMGLGLRNRDADRDKDREKEKEKEKGTDVVKSGSVIILEGGEREGEGSVRGKHNGVGVGAGMGVCVTVGIAGLVRRLLSSNIAGQAFRDAMEREREKKGEGEMEGEKEGHSFSCPSLLTMAGWT